MPLPVSRDCPFQCSFADATEGYDFTSNPIFCHVFPILDPRPFSMLRPLFSHFRLSARSPFYARPPVSQQRTLVFHVWADVLVSFVTVLMLSRKWVWMERFLRSEKLPPEPLPFSPVQMLCVVQKKGRRGRRQRDGQKAFGFRCDKCVGLWFHKAGCLRC